MLAASCSAAPKPRTLHFVAKSQPDVGFFPQGAPQQGSQIGFGDRISGSDTGTDRGVCTLIGRKLLCTVQVNLSRGTLAVQAILACVQSMIASPQGLAEVLGQLLLHLQRASSPELFRRFGELGLSFTQVKALHLLRDCGDVNVKDVAGRLNISLPAMSRSLDGLVQRGYVDRHESDKDRRAKLVRLLPAGRAVLDEIERARVSALEEFTAQLSDQERAALHETLLPIVERIHTS